MTRGIQMFEEDDKMEVIDIKKVYSISSKPYLFLYFGKGCLPKIVSTDDEEFYGQFERAIRRVKAKKATCNEETRKILEAGIDNVYKEFNYTERAYIDGKAKYVYDLLHKQIVNAKNFQEISLYNWEKDWKRNLEFLGCRFFSTAQEKFYVRIEKSGKYFEIVLLDKLTSAYDKYYAVNAFFSILLEEYADYDRDVIVMNLMPKEVKKLSFEINDYPVVADTDDNKVGVISDHFEMDVNLFTRQLLLPYDSFSKKLKNYQNKGKDEFEILDLMCRDYNYPRNEIKKRICECALIETEENKRTDSVERKPKEKSFFRSLIGY